MDQKILDWIRTQEQGGFSQKQVYDSLIQNGYTDEQARTALNYANNPQASDMQASVLQQQQQQSRPQPQKIQPVQQAKPLVGNGSPRFLSRSIFSVILFSLISFGIYVSIWFDKIIRDSDQNDPSIKTVKELNSLIKYLGIFLIIVTIIFVVLSNMNLTPFLESLNLSSDVMVAIQIGIISQIYFFTLFFFLLGIYAIGLAVAMMLKKTIESAYSAKISGFGMIFGAVYLQKKINEFNSGKNP